MLSSVLNSEQAIQVNIAIMRAFVRMRRMLISHEELSRKVDALEGKYDVQFRTATGSRAGQGRDFSILIPTRWGWNALSAMRRGRAHRVPRPPGES